ncbi:MAG: sulfatase-like hydrolase/transferase [Clostridia bacterium]|nr:sulfatase-like hydrolase/transferase [Clostridia bacterium]
MRIRQKLTKETIEKYIAPVAILLIAANLLTVIMCIVSEGTFLRAFLMPSGWAFVMNTLMVYMPMLVLFFLVRRTWIAFLPISLVFCAFNYFDYLKVSIRGETILPCDFTIITEAAETVGMLELEITVGLIAAIVLTAAITVGLFFFDKLVIRRNGLMIRLRNGAIIAAVTLAVTVAGFFGTFLNPAFLKATGLTAYQWKQLNTRNNNGFLVNFLANIPYVIPEKPSGYGEDSAQATYDEVIAELNEAYTANGDEKPNIIIVMNESFADADKFAYINFEQSTTPTLHETTRTKTGGTHFTPQFGGGTANVEFELLTGYSLRYLPASSTPYQQHVKKVTPSYVSFLRDELGYSTVAIHSYGPHFWNRDNVYPLIGFEKFVSEPDFYLPLRMRTYVSDESTADMIISQYEENRATGKPFFNFTVTMQNHGSYGGGDYDEATMINATDGSADLSSRVFGAIRSYATSIKFADDMLRQLTDYFSTCGEPTIIMFFGDHLGSFGNKDSSYYAAGYTKNTSDTLPGFYDLHTPPFVIWDNYTDVSASPDTSLSTYYLIPYMTEIYSLPQPVYFKYLLQQSELVKGTGGDYYLRGDGSIAESGSVTEEENAELERQHLFQYDALFGKQYVTDKIWAKYKE